MTREEAYREVNLALDKGADLLELATKYLARSRQAEADCKLEMERCQKMTAERDEARREVEGLEEELGQPTFTCAECGNSNRERLKTVTTETSFGTEYDLECMNCGSDRVFDSPQEAITDAVHEASKDAAAQAREKALGEVLSWLEKDDGDFVKWKIEQALKQKEDA